MGDTAGIQIPEVVVITPEPISEPETLPVSVPVQVQAPTISDVYLSQLGVREATGKNDGPEVEKYLRSVGLGKGNAWCSAFVHWCMKEAGLPNKINAWSPTAHNPKNIIYMAGKLREEPKAGDVGTLYYSKLKRIGHAYFYHERLNSTVYKSVEGNTNEAGSREGDGVYMKYRSFNATYSITRWP